MLRLTVVRHGTTGWNEAGRYQGWGDPPLSERGRAEAERLRARLAGEAWDRVVASDLLRARETAAIAVPGVEAATDRRLRELHFGAWEGLTWDECTARDGDLPRRWAEDPSAHAPPEGESAAALGERVAAALDDLPAAGSVLVVTHAGVIHALLARWLGVTLRETLPLRIAACGITRAELFRGGVRVTCVNDTAHMEEGVSWSR
ncbi:MAG TPA: histidine phosphatase family protein [Longimicrobiaceae bacterium]|nr:histidine phosphatase family protein [Longimicrobiaceae bacterium]